MVHQVRPSVRPRASSLMFATCTLMFRPASDEVGPRAGVCEGAAPLRASEPRVPQRPQLPPRLFERK
eukprot:2629224-Rhodomonas_salina.2